VSYIHLLELFLYEVLMNLSDLVEQHIHHVLRSLFSYCELVTSTELCKCLNISSKKFLLKDENYS
jgi:hypothetical protein